MDTCPRHEDIERRIANIEGRMDEMDKRVDGLADSSVRGEEQMKTVFRILGEIKDMLASYTQRMEARIDRLADDLERVKLKPVRLLDGFMMAAVSAGAGALIMYLIK